MDGDTKARAALVEWMRVTGMSQNEMSRRTGIAQTTIGRWCRGDHRPSIKAALAIQDLTYGAVRLTDWVVE